MKYLVISGVLAAAYLLIFGLYPRYFDIAWDEEVQLHDGKIIIVHVKRTFERRGWRFSRYDDSHSNVRRNEFTFKLGSETIVFSTRMPVAYLGEIRGTWYAVISGQGPYGNYPDEMPNHWGSDFSTREQRLAILKGLNFTPAKWGQAPPELDRINLSTIYSLVDLVPLSNTLVTVDQKRRYESTHPSPNGYEITRPIRIMNTEGKN
jgi:hypothetical protein